MPQVWAKGQGGLLDVVLSPNFASDRWVYLSWAEGGKQGSEEEGKAGTVVGRGRLSDDLTKLSNFEVIFTQAPKLSTGNHFGSRLVFDRDGYLFIALGENNQRPTAQDLDKLQGKVVRIFPDRRVPDDNPFVGQAKVRPEIWSYGHRNILSAAIDPKTGKLWEVEHGARGGDELNQPQAGKDYGWPTITYGLEYSGKPIGAGLTAKEGMEQPVYYWDPVIAPAGMAFYEADLFPAWKGNILIGGLASKAVVRLVMQDGKVVGEERLLTDLNERIRDVIVGPDGALYLATDSKNGRVLKVTPKG